MTSGISRRRLRQHGEHALEVFKSDRHYAFKTLSLIGAARSVFGARIKSAQIIGHKIKGARLELKGIQAILVSHFCHAGLDSASNPVEFVRCSDRLPNL